MGIGPGPDCLFNQLDVNAITDLADSTLQDQTILTAQSKDLAPSLINPAAFADIGTLSMTNRTTTANSIARIVKSDNASTANNQPSCNQFDEITQ